MTIGNRKVSFATAARHLMRHLDHPRILEHNPIVGQLFRDPVRRRLLHGRQTEVLAEIKALVVRAAEHFRDLDIRLGYDESAHRQFKILHEYYLGSRKLADIAHDLNISERQCYRTKAAICQRIAQYVREHRATISLRRLAGYSAVDFQLDRASALFELGKSDEAVRQYDDIVRALVDPHQKLQTLCSSAMILTDCGNVDVARQKVEAARRFMLQQNVHDKGTLPILQCKLAFTEARLAWETGRFLHAHQNIKQARVYGEQALALNDHSSTVLYVDVLGEQAHFLEAGGDFIEGLSLLTIAEGLLNRYPCARRQSEIISNRIRLQQLAGIETTDRDISEQRIVALERAVSLARSAQSFRTIIKAMLVMLQQHALVRNTTATLQAATEAHSMASQLADEKMLTLTCSEILDALNFTSQVDMFPNILESVDHKLVRGSLDYARLKLRKAGCALSRKQYADAMAFAADASETACASESLRMQGAAQRLLAIASFRSGNRESAIKWIEQALFNVEARGSLSSRWATYRAAGLITGNPRYERRAIEIDTVLRA